MLRTSHLAASFIVLCASASAQQSATTQPLPSAVKHAGIYHVATGTWTRSSSATANLGPDTIYRNDAPSGYFSTLNNAAATGDWSAIDAGHVPTDASSIAGADRDNYTVDGIEFAYCSGVVGPNTAITFNLYDSYAPCDLIVTAPSAPFTLGGSVSATGLPGGTASGSACWIVTLDFSGGGELCLIGDGGSSNPGEDLDTTLDSFGLEWIFNGAAGTATGPMLAGDPTWSTTTAGSITGVGGGGTYYNPTVNACSTATGLDTEDFFAVDNNNAGIAPGCYFFGGYKNTNGCGLASNTPMGSFHQVLFAQAGICDPIFSYCDPAGVNEDGLMASLTSTADALAGSGMTLHCTGGTAGQAGIVIVSDDVSGILSLSNGTLCLQGFGRYNGNAGPGGHSLGLFSAANVFQALTGNGDANGEGFRVPVQLPTPPGGNVTAGQTWYYQLWYRDNPSLGTYNFSNAASWSF
ncbi:MAG: hypothetical protein ACI9HE_003984 [Planctomycetota bacterium]|jgi:hypothetical protein